MASFELRVPRVKTSPAYGWPASSGVRLGRLCARRLIGHAGGGTVGNDWDEVVGMGGWSGGRDEIILVGLVLGGVVLVAVEAAGLMLASGGGVDEMPGIELR